MTRRERLENLAERRRDWADSRAHKASVLRAATPDSIRHDWAFITQPGHIPERARMNARDERAMQHDEKAREHLSHAAGIEAQLERCIFSDDADAVQEIEARIAEREAERDRIKRYNVSCRAAAKRGEHHGDLSILTEDEKRELLDIMRVCPYQVRPGGAFPPHKLTNLGGRIRADKERLEEIKRRAERTRAAEEAPGGVLIARHPEINWCSVTFAERPERAILDALKGAGYGWGGGCWSGYLDRLPPEVAALVPEVQKPEQ